MTSGLRNLNGSVVLLLKSLSLTNKKQCCCYCLFHTFSKRKPQALMPFRQPILIKSSNTHYLQTKCLSDDPFTGMFSSSSGPKPVIYDKVTDQSYLYGFVNFDSKQQYDKVLAASPHQIDGSSVYVKATGPRYYKSVLHIKRQSRGFAYVYFCSIAEQQKALEHPQHIIDDNTLKVRPKERVAEELTIYVGGLSPKTLSTDLPISTPSMTDWCNPVWSKTQKQGDPSSLDVLLSLLEKDSLRESLSKFGKIVSVTVKPGYGFVIFDTRQAVESAMAAHPYKIDSTFVS
uniref:RRM domain-containing protein n=1 Tax=Ditylenchus dipsaci TaxID=166011 RepID=A0A915D596_9BILA